jgi:hypothetical protein
LKNPDLLSGQNRQCQVRILTGVVVQAGKKAGEVGPQQSNKDESKTENDLREVFGRLPTHFNKRSPQSSIIQPAALEAATSMKTSA